MAKGSGRRRITPADGLTYDPESEMTNAEVRGQQSQMSLQREMQQGGVRDFSAAPTATNDYGSHDGTGTNGRYAGKGRKNDYRCWKNYSRGRQWQKEKD